MIDSGILRRRKEKEDRGIVEDKEMRMRLMEQFLKGQDDRK